MELQLEFDHKVAFSVGIFLDLKSATDRWPLPFMYSIMAVFFCSSLASSLVQGALSYNTFVVPMHGREVSLCFLAGQPLGYYCSWPLFALSHPILVWLAAERVYTGKRFQGYAILEVVLTGLLMSTKKILID